MMLTLAEGPMRLFVGDTPTAERATGQAWYVWALWLGVVVLLWAAVAMTRRCVARRSDAYHALLGTVCRCAGLTDDERTRVFAKLLAMAKGREEGRGAFSAAARGARTADACSSWWTSMRRRLRPSNVLG